MSVSDTTVKLAGVPFRETPVVPVNPCPRIPSGFPTLPESETEFHESGLAPSKSANIVPELLDPPPDVVVP